jgi:hypothetical protein
VIEVVQDYEKEKRLFSLIRELGKYTLITQESSSTLSEMVL